MVEVVVRERVDCGREEFWPIFFSPEFTERWAGALGATEFDVTDQHGNAGGVLYRTSRITLPLQMPPLVRRFFGDVITAEETGTLKDDAWRFTLTPSRMASSLTATGVVDVEADGDHAVFARCVLTGEVRIPAVGKAVESLALPEVRRLARVSVSCMQAHVLERRLLCQS